NRARCQGRQRSRKCLPDLAHRWRGIRSRRLHSRRLHSRRLHSRRPLRPEGLPVAKANPVVAADPLAQGEARRFTEPSVVANRICRRPEQAPLKRSGRAMLDPNRSIADEVEAAINAGSAEKHLETIKRVTDLFLLSADTCNGEQIELFGDVLERLIKTIELRAIAEVSVRVALAEMSTQLASVSKAPPAVVRLLARNDEIAIAGPVLTESARLTNEDLIEIAQTKGELHLLAISGRWWLKEVVTDALFG